MNNNNVFSIEENALKILVEAKNNIEVPKQFPEQMRCYNFNNQHYGKWCSEEEFNKCAAYLADMKAIEFISPCIIVIKGKGINIAVASTMNTSAPTNPTLTWEEAHIIFDAIAEKVNEAIDDGKIVWAELTYPQSYKGSTPIESIEVDEPLKIQFNDGGDPLEISWNSFLGGDGLEEDDLGCYCPTLRFQGLTVEIEVED